MHGRLKGLLFKIELKEDSGTLPFQCQPLNQSKINTLPSSHINRHHLMSALVMHKEYGRILFFFSFSFFIGSESMGRFARSNIVLFLLAYWFRNKWITCFFGENFLAFHLLLKYHSFSIRFKSYDNFLFTGFWDGVRQGEDWAAYQRVCACLFYSISNETLVHR